MVETPSDTGDTVDSIFGGEVKIVQPGKGYRFSVEAVILSRFAASFRSTRICDLGCGSGVIGLCLLRLLPDASLVGVDIQPEMIARARKSASLNGVRARARFEGVDVRGFERYFRRGEFDLVVSNPPFRKAGTSKLSPDASIAVSRNELNGGLGDFVSAASFLLASGGSFCAVLPVSRTADLFTCCTSSDLTPSAVRFIHPRAGDDASFILLRAVKGGKDPLRVLQPLLLHGEVPGGDKYTEEANLLLGPTI